LPIIRSGNHKFFRFGDSIVEKMDKVEVRFSQLLPGKVPDENKRALAKAMLKIKGVADAKPAQNPPSKSATLNFNR